MLKKLQIWENSSLIKLRGVLGKLETYTLTKFIEIVLVTIKNHLTFDG
jgi:hypothetical protein